MSADADESGTAALHQPGAVGAAGRWESGGDAGPRLIVRPGREFVPVGSLGRLVVDPNSTVAQVTRVSQTQWVKITLIVVAVFVYFGAMGGLMAPSMRAGAGAVDVLKQLLIVPLALGLLTLFPPVRRWLGFLSLSSADRIAFDRTDQPAWLAIACQARWSKNPAIATALASKPVWFDVPRWQASLGPTAPRVVSFDVEIPTPTEGFALGEPINSMERESPSRRHFWYVLIVGVLNLPSIWALLTFGLGLRSWVSLPLALLFVGAVVGVSLYSRAGAAKVGLAACRFEPGKLTVVTPRGESIYHATDSVIVCRRLRLRQVLAYVVDSSGRGDVIFMGSDTSSQVLAQVVARWVLRPLEADGRSKEGGSHG